MQRNGGFELMLDYKAVFLNVPYDRKFQPLYLAYIVGLVHLGFQPRATLALPGGTRRLEKILGQIRQCRYSVHDLSRVQMDRHLPSTPRFNMPFELGLAVDWANIHPSSHTWFVFESDPYRLQKSLSDLNGTDPHVHRQTVKGVLSELCNAFVRRQRQPAVPDMLATHRIVTRNLPRILHDSGAGSPYEARAFQNILLATRLTVESRL
jgi:hypothetical protein